MLGRAGERGQERRKAEAAKGICTWRNQPDIEKWMEGEQTKAANAAKAEREAQRAGGGREEFGSSRSIF